MEHNRCIAQEGEQMIRKTSWAIIGLLAIMASGLGVTAAGRAQEDTPQIVAPTGPYAVGRTTFTWVDPARDEVHSAAPDDKRRLLVEAWYPTDPDPAAVYSPYMESAAAAIWSQQNGLDADRMAVVQSNAVVDAPLSAALPAYPVLIFDPGFSVMPRQYTVLLEEFASQGYVVFAISHPYITFMTLFPDGTTILTLSESLLTTLWKPRNIMDAEFAEMWEPDMRFVLGQIDRLNADASSPFGGRLALDEIGLIGHSMGGRTVSEVCLHEDRCVGAVNLDGAYSAEVELEYRKPYMMILADNGVSYFESMYRYSLEALASEYYVLMVPRTQHMSFADTMFLLPLLYDDSSLPVSENAMYLGQVALIEYRAYTVAFFDKYLRHYDVPLLDGPSANHPLMFYLEREEPIPSPVAGVEPQPASREAGANRGEIAVGEADVWTYEGQAGEVLDLQLKADHPAGNTTAEERSEQGLLDTLLVVRAPDGSLLTANDDAADDDTNSILTGVTLPAAGMYRIEVRSWGGQTAGGYTLLIESK
jgi:pimeloyl-ACP methyl ester carboxylesterase